MKDGFDVLFTFPQALSTLLQRLDASFDDLMCIWVCAVLEPGCVLLTVTAHCMVVCFAFG